MVGDWKDFHTIMTTSIVGNPRHPNAKNENRKSSAAEPGSVPIPKITEMGIKAPSDQVTFQPILIIVLGGDSPTGAP